MDKKQIDIFFKTLNQRIKDSVHRKVKIILTGAAAGVLLGANRPSIDIDFAIDCDKRYWDAIEKATKEASDIAGIAVNFSQDIDRWSQITFLDYKRHIIKYKTFGVVEVSILSPDYWSIGKITRYLEPDVDDLVKVLKNNSIPAIKLATLWGEALSKSPRSSACFTFRRHVEHFFKAYGRVIWGKNFDETRRLEEFWRAAGHAGHKH